MKKWKNVALFTGTCLAICCLTVHLCLRPYRGMEKLASAVDTLEEEGYGQKSREELIEGGMQGVAQAAGDPYTMYHNVKDMEQLSGLFSAQEHPAIGAELIEGEEGLLVVWVFQGSPAEQAGLQKQDLIYAIDGKRVSKAADLDGFATGQTIRISYLRKGVAQDTICLLQQMKIPSVEYEQLQEGIGYVRLRDFSMENVETDFRALLVGKETNDGLIIDLRGNPGGRLDAVLYLCDLFLERGKPLLYLKDAEGNLEECVTQSDSRFDMPVAILMDGQSASASEIFAGAMQDHGRATIVGEKSYGKGLVQMVEEYKDGSGLRYSFAEYLLPKKERVQNVGITPDIPVSSNLSDNLSGWAVSKDEDIQLQRAMDLFSQ